MLVFRTVEDESDVPQGCVATQLYDFSFQCGSVGPVHISDFFPNSQMGKTFGAHREGDQIILNGGQQRVLISHRYGDCFGKGLSLSDTSRCIESSDQSRIDQIWITLPAGRVPLPNETKLTTRAIGDDCGNGLLCNPGNKCSIGGGCVPSSSVDCGKGTSCPIGTTCQVSSSGTICQRPNSPAPAPSQPPVIPPFDPALIALYKEIVALVLSTLLTVGVSSIATRLASSVAKGGSQFWHQVRAGIVAGIITNLVCAPFLWYFQLISDLKLVSIPILSFPVGVVAVALIFTPSSTS